MSVEALPTVRLRPNKGKAFLGGHPWVYKEELVLDRRTSALPTGSLAILEDSKRVPVGIIALNPNSGLVGRELTRDPAHIPDAEWIERRLARALAVRSQHYDAPYYRLCHGEGDGLPGLVIDRIDGAIVIQPNTAWAETHLTDILAALDTLIAPSIVVINRDSRGRAMEGLDSGREIVRGTLDGPLLVQTRGAHLLADLTEGQKTGLYFDQVPNHQRVAELAQDKQIVDVFSHTGGFSLAALRGGARSATAIDSSASALALAAQAAQQQGFEGFEARQGDAFDIMKELASAGTQFDIAICDPPAFVPRKAALEAGLRAYEKAASFALPLVREGGVFVMCSCSHAVTPDILRGAVARALHRQKRTGRLIHSGRAGPDHPVHAALPESGYLKSLFFALD